MNVSSGWRSCRWHDADLLRDEGGAAFLHGITALPTQGTAVEVLELIPPYVQTTLTGEHQANDPRAMPLEAFIAEVMEILKTDPVPRGEICVGNVYPLRFAADEGPEKYARTFQGFNDAMSAAAAH